MKQQNLVTNDIDAIITPKRKNRFNYFIKIFRRDKYLIILMLPALAYYLIFHYAPMAGAIIAFKDFIPTKGIFGSEWVGFKWFEQFFSSIYFTRLLRNTVLLSVYSILWGFPVPIIFALMLNEIKDGPFKRVVQTISYLPHFISVAVLVGLLVTLLSPTGVVNVAIQALTGKTISFMSDPKWFRTVYVASGVWQEFGWNSIIYLAALSSIDPTLYEAAKVDGASRWKQMWNITLPGIMPTAIILLILNVGNLLNVGFEKIILMYSPATYETADVISTYVYRRGILSAQYSFGTAVGLFNSIANLLILITVNWISGKVSETSLW